MVVLPGQGMAHGDPTPEESAAQCWKQLGRRVQTDVVSVGSVKNSSRLSICSFRVDTDKSTVMLAIIPVHARCVQLVSIGNRVCYLISVG